MFRVQFRVHYHRRTTLRVLFALVLLPIVLLVTLTVNRVRATTPNPSSFLSAAPGVRQFYLTQSSFKANEAPTVCAEGYHFASIWEIADPSGLKYNTSLGKTSSDSGAGPPTAVPIFLGTQLVRGWVRTGYNAWSSDTVGRANCTAWASDYAFDWGTVANLPATWTDGDQDLGVWNLEVRTCDTSSIRVWCVQDDVNSALGVFLPLVLKGN
jgi:hypothetical protein